LFQVISQNFKASVIDFHAVYILLILQRQSNETDH